MSLTHGAGLFVQDAQRVGYPRDPLCPLVTSCFRQMDGGQGTLVRAEEGSISKKRSVRDLRRDCTMERALTGGREDRGEAGHMQTPGTR